MKAAALLCLIPLLILNACKDCDPIRCSQTIEIRPDADFGKDAFLHSEFPDRTHGNAKDNVITAWTFYALGKGPGVTRVLLEFDLSSIPADATIDKASLNLYNSKITNNNNGEHSTRNGSNACDVHLVTEAWGEHDVTWNSQPATSTSISTSLAQSTSVTQDYTDQDLTEFVEYWHKNPDQNHGMLFKLKNENYYRCLVFASSDSEHPETRPMLRVTYH